MESLGTGRNGAGRGAKGRKGAQRGRNGQEEAFPLLSPFPAIPSLVLSSLKPLLAP